MRDFLKYIPVLLLFLQTMTVFGETPKETPVMQMQSFRELWTTSVNPENSVLDLKFSAIPFHFPFEISLTPQYRPVILPLGSDLLYRTPANQTIFRWSGPVFEGNLSAYETSSFPSDRISRTSNDSLRTPAPWMPMPASSYRSPGIVFVYMKKNLGISLDMAFRLSGTLIENTLEQMVSTISLHYSLPFELAKKSYQARFSVNLQSLESSVWEEKLKKTEPKFNRNLFVSPGFTVGNRSVMIEGLVRMPVHGQGAQLETDALLRPEIQGRLGIKWHLPDMMRP